MDTLTPPLEARSMAFTAFTAQAAELLGALEKTGESRKPYGFEVLYERAKPNGGLFPQVEERSIRRKGTRAAAERAAQMCYGFRRIISVTEIPADQAPAPRRPSFGGSTKNPIVAEPAPGQAVLTPDEADEIASAIRDVKEASATLAAISAQKSDLLWKIGDHLDLVAKLYPESGPTGIANLKERCDRLKELVNMEELQSWKITVDRIMGEAWQRLP
jgi:hypothetical protein